MNRYDEDTAADLYLAVFEAVVDEVNRAGTGRAVPVAMRAFRDFGVSYTTYHNTVRNALKAAYKAA